MDMHKLLYAEFIFEQNLIFHLELLTQRYKFFSKKNNYYFCSIMRKIKPYDHCISYTIYTN